MEVLFLTSLYLAVCMSSICLFLSCVFYNKLSNNYLVASCSVRHASLHVEISKETLALTINRIYDSGFPSIVNGYHEICVKNAEIILCQGAKNMSQTPFCVRNMCIRNKFGLDLKLKILCEQH